MKTKYKYFLLIIITVVVSIFIYNYIEANTNVKMEDDILKKQNSIETGLKSDNNYSINEPKVILNPYENSPLTALIIFSTNDLTPVTVTVKGKDNDKDIVNTFVPSNTHYISVYGLYPDYENKVIIKAGDDSNEVTIKTDALPKGISNATSVSDDADEFYFTTSSDGYPVAFDKNGNVRWYLNKKYSFDFTRLSNGYVLLGSDELMKSPNYSSSLLEMDLLGKIYYEYRLPGGYYNDVYEMNNGNLLALTNDFESGTIKDVIVAIDRKTGEIEKEFNLYDLMPNDDGEDWISLNSINYDSETNSIIVCGSNKDMIISIDYNTGKINWVIGAGSENNLEVINGATLPNKPQGLVLTKNGVAFINSSNNENSLIEYKIDRTSRSVSENANVKLGTKANNVNLEYVNGKFIVTRDDVIQEVIDGDVKNTMTAGSNLYSAKVSDLYAGDIFMLQDAVKLGHIGMTPTTSNHTIFIHSTDKNVFKKYNLSLVQNSNRLIVKGEFNKNDNVQIILDNVLVQHTYDVDVASGTKLKNGKFYTETFINKEGIYGKHYIYLRINAKVYKLEKFIIT